MSWERRERPGGRREERGERGEEGGERKEGQGRRREEREREAGREEKDGGGGGGGGNTYSRERKEDQWMYILQGVLVVGAASLNSEPLEGRSSREQRHDPGGKPR